MNLPDYSNYTLSELYEALENINKEKYSDRYELIVREIQKREKIKQTYPDIDKGRPVMPKNWIKITGIISIVFGALCVLSNFTGFFTADLLDMTKNLAKKAAEDSKLFSELADQFIIPDWYKTWIKTKSIISMLNGVFLILIGIKYIEKKPRYNLYLIISLFFNIIIYIANIFLVPFASETFIIMMSTGTVFSNIIEVSLLVYLFTKGKKDYMLAT